MKKFLILIFLCLPGFLLTAQEISEDYVEIANEESSETEGIQAVIDACLLLSKSAESNDSTALRQASEALNKCNITDFVMLRQKEDEDPELYGRVPNYRQNPDYDNIKPLDGHLVFNKAFADSLAKGGNPYPNADEISRKRRDRGSNRGGAINTKTCLIKAGSKAVYTFNSHNKQELAFVAEPGGLISTRVHAVNKAKGINEWHNDTVDVAKGRNYRKTSFKLPANPPTQLTLEITNCTNKSISVVVISN